VRPIPWFKVDDNLAFHAKTIAAGNAAMGMWVRAGSWSAQTLTDGFIPAHMLNSFGSKSLAKKLVQSGFWVEAEGGYQFHEWEDRQPTREAVEKDRTAARERVRAAREAKRTGNVRANTPRNNAGTSEDVRSTRPDPTRPTTSNDVVTTSHEAESEGRPNLELIIDPDPEPAPKATGYTPDFEAWWKHYPRTEGKGAAAKAYANARKSTAPAVLLEAIQAYATDPNLPQGDEARFIPHGSRWLNERRWEDGPLPVRRGTQQPVSRKEQTLAFLHQEFLKGDDSPPPFGAVTHTTRKELTA
jgi:hypothetical protein